MPSAFNLLKYIYRDQLALIKKSLWFSPHVKHETLHHWNQKYVEISRQSMIYFNTI